MPVYDTDIEDVIEEEEGLVGKGGIGGEEDNIEDFVVVANDICYSMIQTTLSIDFEENINTKSHELMSFGKTITIKSMKSNQLKRGNSVLQMTKLKGQNGPIKREARKNQDKELLIPLQKKYLGIDDVKKNNIGEGAILALLNYSPDSDDVFDLSPYSGESKDEENSRTSFSQAGEDDAGTLDRNVNLVEYLEF
uniref:Uncharacterized protein n=1 Tax=Tanacetum cinerariifolium TaxID=118510 RepID=A0A699JTC5_TANCI|nr:hypothetical protein [Tanacetum cinerariifolium]GFA52275.1 hypothetical protein [Tanacetum cinerariifolium]